MTRTTGRVIPIYMIIVLALLFSFAFFAFVQTSEPAYADGDMPVYNSSDDVYEISTAEQLIKLSDLVAAGEQTGGKYYASLSYILKNDIDLSGKTWTPIGTGEQNYYLYCDVSSDILISYNNDLEDGKPTFQASWDEKHTCLYTAADGSAVAGPAYDPSETYYLPYQTPKAFYGVFDGDGYAISGITYGSSSLYGGVFGYLKNAVVKNLKLSDSSLTLTSGGNDMLGGIAGYAENSAVISCGIVDTVLSANAYVGGIIGKSEGPTEVYTDVTELNAFVGAYAQTLFNQPQSPSVQSCYSIGGTLSSSGKTGGILGCGEDGSTLEYCFNASVVVQSGSTSVQVGEDSVSVRTGAGIIGWSNSYAYANYCLGVSFTQTNGIVEYGAVCSAGNNVGCYACYRPVDDDYTEETGLLAADGEVHSCNLFTLISPSMVQSLGNGFWKQGGTQSGATRYYPVPLSCDEVATFDAYSVTVNGAFCELHYSGYVYTYPAEDALTKAGYTLTSWKDGSETQRAFSSEQTLTGNLTVLPVWELNAPTLVLNNSYSYVYNGSDRTITPSFAHPAAGLTATYTWQKGEGTPYQATQLTVKNVSDTATYSCSVSVTDGETYAVSETKILTVTVHPKSLTVTVRLFENNAQNEAAATREYDGDYVSAPSFGASGLIDGHSITPTYTYLSGETTVTRAETTEVGSYFISATVLIRDGDENNCTANYSVTVNPYSYTVTPATIILSCAYASGMNLTYDGTAHTLTASDFTITTVNSQTYTLTIEGVYTDVTASSVISYSVTAPNHNDVTGTVNVTISPLSLTLAAEAVTFSKTYDGTTTLFASLVEGTDYTVSSDSYEGARAPIIVTSAVFSQSNAGENLTVTANFAIENNNNFLLTVSSLTYENCSITKKEVTIQPKYTFSKRYDGMTTADLSVLTASTYSATDSVSVLPVSGVYDNAHAYEATSVTVVFSLSVDAQTNYYFSDGDSYECVFPASITPAGVRIAAGETPFTKPYDRSDLLSVAAVTSDYYVVTADDGTTPQPTCLSARFNSAHVGATTLTATFMLGSSDYVLETASVVFSASITPIEITIDASSLVATNRDYDETTYVEITGGALLGVLSGDSVGFTLNGGQISSANASETPYSVTVSPITLTSSDYYLADPSPSGLTVLISPATPIVHPQIGATTIYIDDELPAITLSDGDTEGTITWNVTYPTSTGIDLSFGWTFVPSDETNYLSVTGTAEITVQEDVLTGINIYTMPTKLSYTALEAFDITGMVAYAYLESGKLYRLDPDSPSNDGYILTIGDTETAYPGVLHFGDEALYLTFHGFYQAIPITVNKIQLTVPVVSSTERVYAGYPLSPALEYYDEDVMTLSGVTSATDAGEYDFSIALKDTSDYVWTDETNGTKAYSWSILPAGRRPITLGDASFVYSGEEYTVTLRNDNNNDNGFFTSTGTFSATNVGTYSITVTLSQENFYWLNADDPSDRTDVSDKVLSWTIIPMTVQKPALYNTPYVYSGYPHTVITDTSDEYDLIGNLIVTAAGDYSVTAKLKNVYDGDEILYGNYVWADDLSPEPYTINFSVEKRKIAVPSPGITNVTYNGSSYSVKMRSTSYYTLTGTQQATNAGNYQVTAILKDKDNDVWDDGTTDNKTFNWYILPIYIARPTILRRNSYSGYEQTAGITVSDYYRLTGNVAKDVGQYTATASLYDKINYRWEGGSTSDLSIPWEIARSVIEIPAVPKNLLYNGFEQTAYIEPNAAYTITGNVAKERGTYTAKVTLNDTTGYVWSDQTTGQKTYEWGIYGITVVSDGTSESMTASYSLGQTLFTPVRSGYSFDGWYTSSDYSESSKITSVDEIGFDMTVYAKWTKIKGEEVPETVTPSNPSSSGTLSKSSKDKIIAGAIVLGACLVGALLILILGKKRH